MHLQNKLHMPAPSQCINSLHEMDIWIYILHAHHALVLHCKIYFQESKTKFQDHVLSGNNVTFQSLNKCHVGITARPEATNSYQAS